jgi:hypothetical protein
MRKRSKPKKVKEYRKPLEVKKPVVVANVEDYIRLSSGIRCVGCDL